MASISTGQAEGGKRAVDHEIPLVPFIDLLLCCIMFLLVTAVWNQLAAIDVSTPGNGPTGTMDERAQVMPLSVRVGVDGYRIASDAGDEIHIPLAGSEYDLVALREHLAARRHLAPNERTVVVSADDGVAYASLVLAMDTLVGEGFDSVSVDGTR